MKLLFILPEYHREQAGGIRTFYCNLLPALAKAGCGVKVLLACRGTFDSPSYTDEAGVEVEYLRGNLFEKHSRNVAASYLAGQPTLGHYLPVGLAAHEQARGGEGFDLVELTDWPLYFLPWVCFGAKAPFTISLHSSIGQMRDFEPMPGWEMETHFIRLLEGAAFAAAPSVHTNSNLNARYWEGITNRKVEVLLPLVRQMNVASGECRVPSEKRRDAAVASEGLTVNSEKRSNPQLTTCESLHATAPSALPIDSVPRLRGAVFARLQNLKGAEVLCEALRLVPEVAVDWYGRSVPSADGKRTYIEELQEKFPDVFGRQLVHHGVVSHDEALAAMRDSDFVCVPSLWDVFNLTVIEAMAQGCVVICSAKAGAEMLIEDGENGFLCDPSDANSLANAIRKVHVTEQSELDAMGKRAAETIQSRFNPIRLVEERIAYYQQISTEGASKLANPFLRSLLKLPYVAEVKRKNISQAIISRMVNFLQKI
jgi:glycosyltransferase involved in cell wall biosynthesis